MFLDEKKMVFQSTLLSGGLLSAELIFWSICAVSMFRLSPKSLETSHHGCQGLLSPLYPTFSSFVNIFPRIDRKEGSKYVILTIEKNISFIKFYLYKILSYM